MKEKNNKKINGAENEEKIIQPSDIVSEMQTSYLTYAMSVIVSRALPDIRDGLKPVQRRILYAMHRLGLFSGAKHRKSATVVGEVLGKYHPHGDASVYDAMARMAQNFSLRYPLVDGQGNWGCFTKDTKIKLTDSRNLSFEELINEEKLGKKNYTYTVNSIGLISIAKIKNPRLTKKNTKIIKITLDNDKEIKCTPNHLFMLKNGSYRKAQDLTPQDSLMPLYQKLSEKTDRLNREGYILIYQPKKDEWVSAHHLADNFKFIGLQSDRDFLYDKADGWVNWIWENGLIEEVKGLINNGYKETHQMKGLIYKDAVDFLDGKTFVQEAIQRTKFDLHGYVRRQQTWFKKNDQIKWFDIKDKKLSENVQNFVLLS